MPRQARPFLCGRKERAERFALRGSFDSPPCVVDLGVPVLSMHAPFETTAKFDVYMCYKAMYEFMK